MNERVPKIAILDYVVQEIKNKEGFPLNFLEEDMVVSVKTLDINFSFKVLDIIKQEVYIWGDYKHFINPKVAIFQGSKLHPASSMIKIKWIGLDMSLEFTITSDEGQLLWISTSLTQEILINDIVILPNKNDLSIN